MGTLKLIFLAILFFLMYSCTLDLRSGNKNKSITELLSIDSVDRIVFVDGSVHLPIRGEYEVQTPLYVDSVRNKWTNNPDNIKAFLTGLPQIVLDSTSRVIETGCCVEYKTYTFFSKEKVITIGFDNENENLLYVKGGGFLMLNSNSLESLQKYLDRKVLVQETIITKSSDTADLDVINKELSTRGSIFVDSVDRETITKFRLK